MSQDLRTYVDRLGGYRRVAARLGKGTTTMHGYVQQGVLPAKFYDAMCKLADEAGIEHPGRTLFLFDPLSVDPIIDEGEAA